MLEYVSTKLFDSPAQTLVNTVNTVGVMGKGIAKDFASLYPDMYERYHRFCELGQFSVGQLYLYRTPHKWVLNFPTKKHWRQPSRLEWLELGLVKFLATYSQYGITSASFPQLGTGNGGLDWTDVRPLMEKYLKQASIPIYIHERPRDPSFVPEHLSKADVPAKSHELNTAREDIPFEMFVADVQRLLDARLDENDGEELFRLEVPSPDHTTPWIMPGEDLFDFWQVLRLHGAVELSALPASLRNAQHPVADKLLSLQYIKSMEFGPDRRPGLRYAPPSEKAPATTIDVHPE